jgi:hypothetical protein
MAVVVLLRLDASAEWVGAVQDLVFLGGDASTVDSDRWVSGVL